MGLLGGLQTVWVVPRLRCSVIQRYLDPKLYRSKMAYGLILLYLNNRIVSTRALSAPLNNEYRSLPSPERLDRLQAVNQEDQEPVTASPLPCRKKKPTRRRTMAGWTKSWRSMHLSFGESAFTFCFESETLQKHPESAPLNCLRR